MSLNTHSPIPLYQQLADKIRADVENDVYPVNEKIPSEHELAKQYTVGRPTVRQATELLVRQGLLQRKRGSGTFVLPPVQKIDLFSLAGTSEAFQRSELEASSAVIQPARLMETHQDIPAALAATRAFQLKRLSSVAREPVLLEVIYLDADLFRGIDQLAISGNSLSRIVREQYFLEATEAEQSFSIIYPDQEIAQNLRVAQNKPVLQVARTLHLAEHRAAIYCDIFCRTDRFHFSQTIHTAVTHGPLSEGTNA